MNSSSSLLPRASFEFSSKNYWQEFFSKRKNTFEWYCDTPLLAGIINKYINQNDNILVPGCGNSKLGEDLFDFGFSSVVNIDISDVVVKSMIKQNKEKRPGLKFLLMDVKKVLKLHLFLHFKLFHVINVLK